MSLKVEFASVANCTAADVWHVFEDVTRWPRWDPSALRSARWVEGEPWTAGSKLELVILKPMELTLTATLAEVTAPEGFRLTASKSGIDADLQFKFSAVDGGKTELKTVQEFSGAPLMFFGDRARGPLEQGIAYMVGRIQAEAEAAAQNK